MRGKRATSMGTMVVLALLVGAWSAGWARPAVAQNDPVSVVEWFFDRVNEGDVDLALAVFDDNVVIRIGPCLAAFGPDGCVGKERFRPIFEALVDDDLHFTALSLEPSGDTVLTHHEARVGFIAALGIERAIFFGTWEVVGGLIVSVLEEPDLSDAETARFIEITTAPAPAPPATGNAGLAGTNAVLPAWPWQLLALGAALTLTLLGRQLVGRRARA